MSELMFPQPNWQPNWNKACNESLFGEVRQDGMFIL